MATNSQYIGIDSLKNLGIYSGALSKQRAGGTLRAGAPANSSAIANAASALSADPENTGAYVSPFATAASNAADALPQTTANSGAGEYAAPFVPVSRANAPSGVTPGGRTPQPWSPDPATLPAYAMDASDPRNIGSTWTNTGQVFGPQHVENGQIVSGAIYAPQTQLQSSSALPDTTSYPTITPGESPKDFLRSAGLLFTRDTGPPPAGGQAAILDAMENYRQQQSQVSPISGMSADEFLRLEQTPGNQYYGGSYGLSAAQLAAVATGSS